ncbi:hypothetical protein D9M71_496390 [compost metagenome]
MTFWRLTCNRRITQIPGPSELPGLRIERADYARRFAGFLVVPHQPTDNDQITNHCGCRSRKIQILILVPHANAQTHAAMVAKISAGLPGLRIHCDQSCIDGGGDDPSCTGLWASSRGRGGLLRCRVVVTHAATARVGVVGFHLGIVMPDFFTRVGVQREQLTGLGAAVDHAIDMKRRYDMALAACGNFACPVGPRHLQTRYVLRCDLVDHSMACARRCVAEIAPVGRRLHRADRVARYRCGHPFRRLNGLWL